MTKNSNTLFCNYFYFFIFELIRLKFNIMKLYYILPSTMSFGDVKIDYIRAVLLKLK